MILIADSGSTKTDWAFVADGKISKRIQTAGINPVHMNSEEIKSILSPLSLYVNPQEVHFYGAGCIEPFRSELVQALQSLFVDAQVTVDTDLLGAARSLFGHESGIACILGTGSNSCVYEGGQIVANTPPMGYILGDEGSGAYMGRLFLKYLFKGQLSTELRDGFLHEYHLTYEEIINKVYRQTGANRFLASLCPFIHRHMSFGEVPAVNHDTEVLNTVVRTAFEDFFNFNIRPYHRSTLPIGFVGSIAWHFRSFLTPISEDMMGHPVKSILQSPMEGLVRFHSK